MNNRYKRIKLEEIKNPLPVYEWTKLEEEGKYLLDKIEIRWKKLLHGKEKEEVYQSFISEYAGFFFGNITECYFSISKLRLGADYITDFIYCIDEHSNGLTYNFVEIETPHYPPFTKKGNPSARLSNAIQQIMSWKSWIKNNRDEVRKLLPAIGHRVYRNPNIRFIIIIGNRSNSKKWIERRFDISEELKISIRSFDYLSDLLKKRMIDNYVWEFSAELMQLDSSVLNGLANPFYTAYTDSSWRRIISEMSPYTHFTPYNAEILLKYRRYNELFNEFTRNYENIIEESSS